MAHRRSTRSARDYPRTARLNELLREILGDAIERIDDDDLGIISVSGVDVDTELTLAKVYLSMIDDDPAPVLAALVAHRGELKAAIARQTRLRRTPELVFYADPAIGGGVRIETLLRDLRAQGAMGPDDPEGDPAAPDTDADQDPPR